MGDIVAINGRLHYSSWENRDVITRYDCKIIANSIDFFGPGGAPQSPLTASPSASGASAV